MLNLISKHPDKVIEQIGIHDYRLYCGMLSTPRTGYDLTSAVIAGVGWALDNGCFVKYEPKRILFTLRKWQSLRGCLFAVLPDVVGNHAETYLLSMQWLPIFHKYDYPPAFVIQNGCTVQAIPWCDIACIFIGGDDNYKKSQAVRDICHEAKLRGIWIHAGRVGGKARFRYSRDELGIDSFDSTGFSIYPPKLVEEKWIEEMKVKQLKLGIQ